MQIRDLTLVALPNNQLLLTACDISAAIGEKEHDVLKVPPELTGRLTARVALLEMIASGANVVAISNVVGSEMEPTGKRLIAGIKEELKNAGLSHIQLNGSTEENMKTSQSSIGVLVTGIASQNQLKLNNIKEDAMLLAYGEPRVGNEVLERAELEVSYQLVRQFVHRPDVLELVPVGSKGIRNEAILLAKLNDCEFIEENTCPDYWMNKSAGPATTVLIAVQKEKVDTFLAVYPQSYKIGLLRKNSILDYRVY